MVRFLTYSTVKKTVTSSLSVCAPLAVLRLSVWNCQVPRCLTRTKTDLGLHHDQTYLGPKSVALSFAILE